ncbi:hypothetical protein CCYA_CCYA01G0395 [Cyanidiococcus yangmingshanensis]|nr:hypothetical protein CCYA_CCYA01G0395 [Cyanidiococcus yangmingshanensis]
MDPTQSLAERERKHWRSCERRLGDVTRALQHNLLRQERDLAHALLYRNANQHRRHAYYQGLHGAVRALDRLDATSRTFQVAQQASDVEIEATSWLPVLGWLQLKLQEQLYEETQTESLSKSGSGAKLRSLAAKRPSLEELDSALAPPLDLAIEWLAMVRRRLRLSAKHAWHHLVLRANFLALGMALVAAAGRMHAVVERALEGVVEARRHLHLARMERKRRIRGELVCTKARQQNQRQKVPGSVHLKMFRSICSLQPSLSDDSGSKASERLGKARDHEGAVDSHSEASHRPRSLYQALDASCRSTGAWTAAAAADGASNNCFVAGAAIDTDRPRPVQRSSSADSLDEIFAAAEAFEARRREQLMRYL